MERRWELDALRGVMLVLMTLTHLPTLFSSPFGQPFGFVSAAEGFVLLSAYMCGVVYTQREQREQRDGEEPMRSALLQRAFKIYLCQAALLVFLFSFIAGIGLLADQDAVKNLMSFYLERPVVAVVGSLLLLYNPPLLDILPMYIVFMLASPVLLVLGLRRGWTPVLALSVAGWFGAQFGLGRVLQAQLIALTGLPVPPQQGGAFDILAWQFLWVLGLWMGSSQAAKRPAVPQGLPHWAVLAAVAIGVAGTVWRHAVGQAAFPTLPGTAIPNMLFDKWRLGPLRMLDLFALLLLVLHFGPWLKQRLPRLRFLETLGSASLPVFCAHLVVALLALALWGEPDKERSIGIDLGILFGGFAVLYAVALISQQLDCRAAAVQKRFKERRAARLARLAATSGERRSPTSRAHSPPH